MMIKRDICSQHRVGFIMSRVGVVHMQINELISCNLCTYLHENDDKFMFSFFKWLFLYLLRYFYFSRFIHTLEEFSDTEII